MYETVYYKIAGLVIQVDSDLPFSLREVAGQNFLTYEQKPDFTFSFQKIGSLDDIKNNCTELVEKTSWCHIYQRGRQLVIFQLYMVNFYVIATVFDGYTGVCYYLDENLMVEKYRQGCTHFSYMGLEYILHLYDSYILHSSHVEKNGTSILFSAPSQTGKSTQADLWKQYGQYEIVNGDRTAIRKVDGQWKSYGLPVCGTSNISLNSTARLSAVIILRQNIRNEVLPMSPSAAFRAIYSESTIHSWDRAFINDAMNTYNVLVKEVPIYLYQCTAMPDAFFFCGIT